MKIAVVTGASSGIGREFVRQIAYKYRTIDEIWVLARRVERLNELKREIISEELNVKIRVIGCDITNQSELLIYRNLLKEKHAKVRILVNAAGYGMIGPFDGLSEQENLGMCELNCVALTRFTYINLKYMDKNGSNIINIASSAAFIPQPDFAVYAASKSYVLSFSRALNRELRNTGITVTSVCPGPVSTEFFDIAETHNSVKVYKKLFRVEAPKVVELALRDAYHKKEVSVYGISMKALMLISKLVPHSICMKFIK